MPKELEASTWIERSPEDVWNYLSEASNEVLWRYGVHFADWITDPPHKVGSIGYHFVLIHGDYPWEVVEWEEPQHMRWYIFDGRFKGAYAGYRVSPEDGGSRMTIYINGYKSFLVKT
ncbi:MAG: SRPBCC family protein, partial [Dehalococcoidales bacterium]